jgi:spore maturation protein CgeB
VSVRFRPTAPFLLTSFSIPAFFSFFLPFFTYLVVYSYNKGMNVVFFKSKTFLAQEMENSLKKRKDLNLLITNIPEKIPAQAAHSVLDQIKGHLPAIIISINDAGYDLQGTLSELLSAAGCYQCNWFLDDPFYERIFYNCRQGNMKNRLDFVSEESFATKMNEKGYHAHFLPLATDPLYFNMKNESEIKRDCAFVGNSSLGLLDSVITAETSKEFEKHARLISDLKNRYFADPRETDIKKILLTKSSQWEHSTGMPSEQFLFRMEWLIGYFYRRDFIVEIARQLKNRFMCFGDIYWSKFIDPSQVSTDACYYTNLCDYYRSTKVNLNINRIQIRTGFTQRIFDCKASGAFVLTEKRKLNERFFITQGEGQELVEFTSWKECLDLIDYYCEHEEERERIAMAGRDKVLSEHTYDRRVEEIFVRCRKEWGI